MQLFEHANRLCKFRRGKDIPSLHWKSLFDAMLSRYRCAIQQQKEQGRDVETEDIKSSDRLFGSVA